MIQRVFFLLCLGSAVLFLPLVWAQESNLEAEIRAAEAAHARGQRELAITHWEAALLLAPESPRVCRALGLLLLQKKNTVQRAFTLLEKSLPTEPTYQDHDELANLAEKHRQYALAIKHYEACVQLKVSAGLHQKLSLLYHKHQQPDKALYHRQQRVALELVKVRQLPFKQPVQVGIKNKEELKAFLLEELAKEMPPQKCLAIQSTLAAFGLAPADLDIKKMFVRLLTEQIAGFYNPETKQLYLIAQPPVARGFWEKLISDPDDDSDERMLMAHEMTHAIQDQHFDLLPLQKSVEDNDDRSIAITALIEGDATLAMMDYLMWPQRVTGQQAASFRWSFSLMSFMAPLMGGAELAKAPTIIRESLLFPYTEGFFFCLDLRVHGGQSRIDEAFRIYPLSSEHILHPKKFLAREDEPVDFMLPDLSAELGAGWNCVESNVMGEFGCQVFAREFSLANAREIAAGWAGDRYRVYRHPDGSLALVWVTTWDTLEDANEFYAGYAELLPARYPGWKTVGPLAWDDDHCALAKKQGQDVWVVEGLSREQTTRVMELKIERFTVKFPSSTSKRGE